MTDLNIRIVQGDDVSLVFNVKDKEDVAIDLTGVTAVTFVAKTSINATAHIDLDLTSGVAVSDATGGEITVTLTNTNTSDDNLPAGEYAFELQITDSGGLISTVRDFNDALGCLEVLADLDN